MVDKFEKIVNIILGLLIGIEIVVSTISLSYEDFGVTTRRILLNANIVLIIFIILLSIISAIMFHFHKKDRV